MQGPIRSVFFGTACPFVFARALGSWAGHALLYTHVRMGLMGHHRHRAAGAGHGRAQYGAHVSFDHVVRIYMVWSSSIEGLLRLPLQEVLVFIQWL